MTKPRTRNRRFHARLLTAVMAAGFLTTAAQAADSKAWELYQEFVAECATASSMEELLPFLPQWRHKRHEASDEADREATFERLCKDARDLENITFISEETKGSKTTLQLKASWGDFPMKGKVTILQEDDSLKVDEWFWATGR